MTLLPITALKSRLHRLCELAVGFAAAMLITVSPFVIFAEVLW